MNSGFYDYDGEEGALGGYMEEAMAWGLEREDEAEREWNTFVARQAKIWTPHEVFKQCCVKWLAFGSEDEDEYDKFEDELNDGNVVGRGCSYCYRDHPTLSLRQIMVAVASDKVDKDSNSISPAKRVPQTLILSFAPIGQASGLHQEAGSGTLERAHLQARLWNERNHWTSQYGWKDPETFDSCEERAEEEAEVATQRLIRK